MKSTTSITPNKIQRAWHEIDAQDETLGRLSARVVALLTGKRKAYYVPHQDCGDYVVIINADKVKVTGNKEELHVYYRHSGFPGGIKSETLGQVRDKDPRKVLERTLKGMLPKSKLGRAMIKKLFVYSGDEHPYKERVKVLNTLS